MKYSKGFSIILPVLIAILIFSCVPKPSEKPEVSPPPQKSKIPLDQQEKLARELFAEMLEMTAGVDRYSVLPQLVEKYMQIIAEAPDSDIAEESHWRIIQLTMRDMKPSKPDVAEQIFASLKSNYPQSNWISVAEDTIVRYYYYNQVWNKVIEITTPSVLDYIKTGELKSPFYLFLYTEAKYNFKELDEAEKGYRTIMAVFPNTQESKISKQRLEEIESQKK